MIIEDKHIWSLILTFLDLNSLLASERVCQLWRGSIDDHRLWQARYYNSYHVAKTIKVIKQEEKKAEEIDGKVVEKANEEDREKKSRKVEEIIVHKPLDVKNVNFKLLYQKRYIQALKYAPVLDTQFVKVVSTDYKNVIQNIGTKVGFWGIYQYTHGVMMNCEIGISKWLKMLGFTANYFEVCLSNGSVGFSTHKAKANNHVGWDPGSIGYHSDDGSVHSGIESKHSGIESKQQATPFGENDIVGCGFVYTMKRNQTVFFTHNGKMVLETPYSFPCDKLFPKVTLQDSGDHVWFNMGNRPFIFDVVDYLEQKEAESESE